MNDDDTKTNEIAELECKIYNRFQKQFPDTDIRFNDGPNQITLIAIALIAWRDHQFEKMQDEIDEIMIPPRNGDDIDG